MSQLAVERYGAVELKITYQRNMALAMALIIILTAAIIGLMYFFAGAPPIEIIPDDTQLVVIKADLMPLPNIVKPQPRVRGNAGTRNPPVVSSNLIPIDDDEFVDMDGGLLPTRDELYEIVDQGRFGEGNFGANTVIDSIVDNYKKAPPDFTYCEIYPEVIYTVQPEYPRQARMVGLTATVWVRILVGKNGEALDAAVHVSSGSNAGFDEAAVAAALKCKFKPGIQNGKPVEAWVSLKFEFDLND